MRFAVAFNGDVIPIDVPESLTFADFHAYLEAETNVSSGNQQMIKDGTPISGSGTLEAAGIVEGDMIQLVDTGASDLAPPSSTGVPPGADPMIEMTRQQILSNPQLRQQMVAQQPQLEQVLQDPALFRQVMEQSMSQLGQNGPSYEQSAEYRQLMQNPDDPDSQKRIMELIQQEAIDENYRLAYEITPEAFTYVNMLYIDVTIRGHKVQAFVDSGAQVTCILLRLAKEVGIDRLIDKRVMARMEGVGSQMSGGRIHSVPLTVGESNIELPCTFTIIDSKVDLLFGLDMLRRHRGVIDLQQDKLILAGGSVEAKFLPEHEIKNNPFAPKEDGQPLEGESKLETQTSSQNIFKKTDPVPASPQLAAGAPTAARNRPNEAHIKQLVDIGFSRAAAIQALEACNGNVDMAASMLFN